MAGSSRIGAVVLVTLLSCLVLGGVWGVVLLVLPQSEVPSEGVSASVPTPPLAAPAETSLSDRTMTDESSRPGVANSELQPDVPQPSAPPVAEAARMPIGREVKCDLEMDALCPEEEGDRRACLKRKAAQMSLPCRPMLRDKLARMKENWQQLRVACEADRQRFCREVPSAGGEMLLQCLESHAQEVSDQCFQFLPKRGRLLN
ncbi:MAG: cysteine rich repeat-containing protein [Nitrospira sp.]